MVAYNAGAEAFNRRDYPAARAQFEEARRLDPTLAPARSVLARIYVQEKRYAEAASEAEEALRLNPSDKRALLARYEAYRGAGEQARADGAFAALREGDPQGAARAFLDRGTALFERDNIAEACTYLEQALALDPALAKAHYRLGLCYLNQGESAKAKGELEAFLAAAPNDPDAAAAREMLALLAGQKGKP